MDFTHDVDSPHHFCNRHHHLLMKYTEFPDQYVQAKVIHLLEIGVNPTPSPILALSCLVVCASSAPVFGLVCVVTICACACVQPWQLRFHILFEELKGASGVIATGRRSGSGRWSLCVCVCVCSRALLSVCVCANMCLLVCVVLLCDVFFPVVSPSVCVTWWGSPLSPPCTT